MKTMQTLSRDPLGRSPFPSPLLPPESRAQRPTAAEPMADHPLPGAPAQLSAPAGGRRFALRSLLHTADDGVSFGLRLVLAGVMFPHGAQHALGWFGGYGFAGTFGWMTATLGIPAPLAALAIVTELVAPLLLLFGLAGRAAAAGLAAILAVAATTHAANGFFMNWVGTSKGEGFEYHLLGVALALALVVRGSGAYSLDRALSTRRRG